MRLFIEMKNGRGKVMSIAMGAAHTNMPERMCAKEEKLLLITAAIMLKTRAAAVRYGASTPTTDSSGPSSSVRRIIPSTGLLPLTRVISPPESSDSAVRTYGRFAAAAVLNMTLLLRAFMMQPSSVNAIVSEGITQNGTTFSPTFAADRNASIMHSRHDTTISALACSLSLTMLIMPVVMISRPQIMTAIIMIRHTALLTPASNSAPGTGRP